MKEQTMKPQAREDGLVVQELEDETLVYDLLSHKAHCLNRAARAVWRLCDGTRDEGALARLLAKELDGADEDVVRLALRDLARARLLREPPSAHPRVSRRRLIQRLGQSIALPLVVSIVSPTAAQAATCTVPQPISPALCNAGSAGAIGCCCTNHKICLSGGRGCAGAAC